MKKLRSRKIWGNNNTRYRKKVVEMRERAVREWRVFAHFPIKYDPVTCQSWVAGCVFGWNNKGRTRHAGGLILCSHVPSLPKITLVSFASPFPSRFSQVSPRIRIDRVTMEPRIMWHPAIFYREHVYEHVCAFGFSELVKLRHFIALRLGKKFSFNATRLYEKYVLWLILLFVFTKTEILARFSRDRKQCQKCV